MPPYGPSPLQQQQQRMPGLQSLRSFSASSAPAAALMMNLPLNGFTGNTSQHSVAAVMPAPLGSHPSMPEMYGCFVGPATTGMEAQGLPSLLGMQQQGCISSGPATTRAEGMEMRQLQRGLFISGTAVTGVEARQGLSPVPELLG